MSYPDIKDAVEMDKAASEKGFNYHFSKRLIDIVGSLFGIVLFSPLFVIIFIAVKLEDPKAKALYSHKRIGYMGKSLNCWKFRSMVRDADKLFHTLSKEELYEFSQTFKIKDDPRVSKVGRILRKTSMDELPQFFNILKGEMSIVGPRPVVEEEMKLYGEHDWVLTAIIPGLTGYWQVHGRSDTTYEERVAMDVFYARNRSLSLDLQIMVLTLTKEIIRKYGAY